tara:strand:+ start:11292 stop:11876 length:585 start_codon:yes stop_codon:yes gene_type:complete
MKEKTIDYYLFRYGLMVLEFPRWCINNFQTTLNQDSLSYSEKAAALVGSGTLGMLDYFCRSSIPHTINNSFNNLNVRVDWFFKATKDDVKEVLLDNQYQSIVNLGHGSNDNMDLYQSDMSTDEIKEIYGNRARKKGFWFQFTCGGEGGFPLGYYVMENPRRNCLFFSKSLTVFEMSYNGLPDVCLDTYQGDLNG